MENTRLTRLDSWLSIGQKIAVIAGLIVSGWFFILREESSPHVQLSIESEMTAGCVFHATVRIKNLGGRIWHIHSAMTKLYQPNLNRTPTPEELSGQEVGAQIRILDDKLRIGEQTALVFNIEPSAKPTHSFFVVQTTLVIKEENQKWIRVQEGSVHATSCE